MRLADRHGRPISQVASEYPAWELPYWSVWMARTPSDGQRVEIAVARLHQTLIGVNSQKGKQPPTLEKLMTPDYWVEHDERVHRKRAREDVSAVVQAFAQSGIEIIEKPSASAPEGEGYL